MGRDFIKNGTYTRNMCCCRVPYTVLCLFYAVSYAGAFFEGKVIFLLKKECNIVVLGVSHALSVNWIPSLLCDVFKSIFSVTNNMVDIKNRFYSILYQN